MLKKVGIVLVLTAVILFLDLYGKLLISQYMQPDYSSQTQKKSTPITPNNNMEKTETKAVSSLLGREAESLLAMYGEPARVEPSSYDYEWWIYNTDMSSYIQFGILQNKVVTIYAAGAQVNVAPFEIGQSYKEIYNVSPFSYEIPLDYNNSSYQFELSETEMNEQPLVEVEGGWAQLYFDRFTQQLVGVRYLDPETLLKQRPYQLVYSGSLLNPQPPSEEKQREIEAANSKQILDLTNIIRLRHRLQPLVWDEPTAEVAYLHSKDMKENNYFSHESPQFGTLKDRLTRGNVSYQMAGENIASHYVDSIAAVQGWLNSEGHRKNVLNGQFNRLGVGVCDTYYTQNFMQK